MFWFGEERKLRKMAERGDPSSVFQLALFLRNKEIKPTPTDYERGIVEREINELLERSALSGNIEAAYEFGKNLISLDSESSFKWLRHAARSGHINAALQLGHSFNSGYNSLSSKEKTEIFNLVINARDAGNNIADVYIQDMYFMGYGCSYNENEYFMSLERANRSGNLLVKIRLAWCYIFGIGVIASPQQGHDLLYSIYEKVKVNPNSERENLGSELWLSFRFAPIYEENIIKYIFNHYDGVDGFLLNLERDHPVANFILFLAISNDQIPAGQFDQNSLLDRATIAGFPPAMFKYSNTLAFTDERCLELLQGAAVLGYLPAQVSYAKCQTERFHRAAWKTVIFAQESFYGFNHEMNGEFLNADLEDFVLRSLGTITRASSSIVLYEDDLVKPDDIEDFYVVLLDIYLQYVKPFKPVSRGELASAVFNVIRYDESGKSLGLPGDI